MDDVTPRPTKADNDWRHRANCRDVDPEVMQPEFATVAQVEQAKSVCRGCPVFAQCDAERKAQLYPFGVWAGQWFGDQVVPREGTCRGCGAELAPNPHRGKPRQWCGNTCAKRTAREAQRAREPVSA